MQPSMSIHSSPIGFLTLPQITNDQILKELTHAAITAGLCLANKVFVDCSTVHPDTSAEVSMLLADKQASFISAPVFGTSKVAEKGELIFAVAGPASAIASLQPLIKGVMGRAIINMGDDVRKSSLLKIAGYVPPRFQKTTFGNRLTKSLRFIVTLSSSGSWNFSQSRTFWLRRQAWEQKYFTNFWVACLDPQLSRTLQGV